MADGRTPLPLRFSIWDDVLDLWKASRMYRRIFFGGVIIAGGIFLWDMYRRQQPVAVANNLVGAFERGHVPADQDKKDAAAQVPRPAVHAKLASLLRPAATDTYALVVGAHGTGKSTAVRKAAREAPDTRPNGVVYFSVKDPQSFSKKLSEVLGFVYGQLDAREAVRSKVMDEGTTAVPDPATEPHASWRPLADALDAAAKEFRDKHGVPMTLVIDNTQKLASAKPEFLDTLQDFAKDAADSGNLQVVFVSSDFTVLARMQRRSEWSRCAQPLEIGESDVSEQAAVSYLMARLGWPADANHTEVATYIVEHVTGTRFALLNSVDAANDSLEAVKAWEAELLETTTAVLRYHELIGGHPLFARMLAARGAALRNSELASLRISDAKRDALVKADVLAAHTNQTFTCASRHVVGAFEALRTAPAAGTATASH